MPKTLYFLTGFLLIITSIFAGCRNSNNQGVIKASIGKEFTLPLGKSALLSTENFKITFEDVLGDSRCPKGVVCIQAGEAICQLSIIDTGETRSSPESLILKAMGLVDGYSQVKWSHKNVEYIFNYIVEPYPEAGSQINKSDYLLVLKIER